MSTVDHSLASPAAAPLTAHLAARTAPSMATAADSQAADSQAAAESLPPGAVAVPAPTAVRMLYSDDIFGPSREVCIAHRGALYRLRITMQNRLILQK